MLIVFEPTKHGHKVSAHMDSLFVKELRVSLSPESCFPKGCFLGTSHKQKVSTALSGRKNNFCCLSVKKRLLREPCLKQAALTPCRSKSPGS